MEYEIPGTGKDFGGHPPEVISQPYRVYQSILGNYFMGHAPSAVLRCNLNAWAGIINPKNSHVLVYINTFTVSNGTASPFRAEIFLNSDPCGKASPSPFVSPANTALTPLPEPKAILASARNVQTPLHGGTSLFTRIAEADSTVVGNYYGKIILPPGGTFIVYLHAARNRLIEAEVALGWWENRLCGDEHEVEAE